MLLLLMLTATTSFGATDDKKPLPSIARTEIKVSRSLNPDAMETLNVMTKDGNVAQLIVKRREPKRQQDNQVAADSTQQQPHSRAALYANWIPVSSFYYHHPNIIRLDTIALVRNSTQKDKPNVIDSDRYVTLKQYYSFDQHSEKKYNVNFYLNCLIN